MRKKEQEKNIDMKKRLIAVVLFIIIFSISFAQSQSAEFNVCCERTLSGAWCQNTKEANCNNNYRKTPTSCDATSFCKLGCCVDSEEGLCTKNTPQKVCEISSGTWLEDDNCEVSQCSSGCCLLGDQASYVTLTRCKRLSRLYGLETNFRSDITDEVQCILTAHGQDKGACVFDSNGERSCEFTTRQECSSSNSGNLTGETEFFKDYLCSADVLATNCGPTKETICVDGKDEVYFKDSCGNQANIYDSNRIYSKDPSYWQRVVHKSESCEANSGNINSKTCGNCDYLRGSICGKGKAVYGDNYCRDLNCKNTQNGNNYRNGESWCEYLGETGNGLDPVGSRHFRHVCIQGEEVIEPCADFRNEVCIEQLHGPEFGNFLEAACRINRWTDCIDQFTEEDCLNTDKRDCYWTKGFHYEGKTDSANTNLASQTTQNAGRGIVEGGFICLPNVPPGLEFWADANAKSICSLGNSRQTVNFSENIFGTRTCKENCGVLSTSWITRINNVCRSLGDCGAYVNFAEVYTDDGVVWIQNGKRKSIQTGLLENFQGSGTSGGNAAGVNITG